VRVGESARGSVGERARGREGEGERGREGERCLYFGSEDAGGRVVLVCAVRCCGDALECCYGE
jgi:hypothetical protein